MNNKHSYKLVPCLALICSLLLSGCSQSAGSSNTTTTSVNTSSTTTTEVTTTTTESYNFTWEYYDTQAFEKIVKQKYNNMTIAAYVSYFGFSEEFNKLFTDYVNNKYDTNYKSVPFKKANYFFDYIMAGNDIRHRFDDYKNFKRICFNGEYADLSSLNNKLILSYLIQNNIKLGEFLQLDNFKSFMGDELFTYKGWSSKLILKNPKTGNYDKSYKYNKYELYELLLTYNSKLYMLCADNSIKTCNIFESPEAISIYNQHLKQFYGDNAPQIGEVMTQEQYIAIYGEEPLDLSYIPGAVVK